MLSNKSKILKDNLLRLKKLTDVSHEDSKNNMSADKRETVTKIKFLGSNKDRQKQYLGQKTSLC